MADKTITELTATTSAATADEIPIWVAGSAVTRKITKANFLQGAFTGGGTVATGGFTLTVPATGTAALRGADNAFSAVQTMTAGINIGVAASALTRTTSGVIRQAMETSAIANDGALVISTVNSGIVFISDLTDGAFAIISVAGGAGTIISGSASIFTGTAGTASRINVYYLAATGIVIQNKRGSSITVSAIVMF